MSYVEYYNFFPTSERAGGLYREYRGSRCLVRFSLQRWGRSNQQLYLSGEISFLTDCNEPKKLNKITCVCI